MLYIKNIDLSFLNINIKDFIFFATFGYIKYFKQTKFILLYILKYVYNIIYINFSPIHV